MWRYYRTSDLFEATRPTIIAGGNRKLRLSNKNQLLSEYIQDRSNVKMGSALSERTLPVSDRAVPVFVLSERTLPVSALSDRALPVSALSDRALPVSALSERTLPVSDRAVPVFVLSESALPVSAKVEVKVSQLRDVHAPAIAMPRRHHESLFLPPTLPLISISLFRQIWHGPQQLTISLNTPAIPVGAVQGGIPVGIAVARQRSQEIRVKEDPVMPPLGESRGFCMCMDGAWVSTDRHGRVRYRVVDSEVLGCRLFGMGGGSARRLSDNTVSSI
ncbi:hypothetical protein J6590_041550 [Homalodisca vitripennis]|nr:hypothetical protein J6590_041550 [Homalodisca vitripennis]